MRIGTRLAPVAFILLGSLATLRCGAEEEGMDRESLRQELETVYGTVRAAFAEYDLDRARPYLNLPPGSPEPTREQALAMAEFLPDLPRCRFLRLDREGDVAGYYAETDVENESSSEVTVIRFLRSESGWRLAPPPHTMNTLGKDRVDEAALLSWIETEESLRLVPEGGIEAPPAAAPTPPPAGGEGDDRPDREVREELERVWSRLRAAFAAGDVEAARPCLILEEGQALPTPEEAKAALPTLPDLDRCRFLKLGWRRDKPRMVGYFAEADPDAEETSTVVLIVFGRVGDEWRFLPGPVSLERVTVPKTDREGLLRLIETDPRLQL